LVNFMTKVADSALHSFYPRLSFAFLNQADYAERSEAQQTSF
jgi:hypothetical protein